MDKSKEEEVLCLAHIHIQYLEMKTTARDEDEDTVQMRHICEPHGEQCVVIPAHLRSWTKWPMLGFKAVRMIRNHAGSDTDGLVASLLVDATASYHDLLQRLATTVVISDSFWAHIEDAFESADSIDGMSDNESNDTQLRSLARSGFTARAAMIYNMARSKPQQTPVKVPNTPSKRVNLLADLKTPGSKRSYDAMASASSPGQMKSSKSPSSGSYTLKNERHTEDDEDAFAAWKQQYQDSGKRLYAPSELTSFKQLYVDGYLRCHCKEHDGEPMKAEQNLSGGNANVHKYVLYWSCGKGRAAYLRCRLWMLHHAVMAMLADFDSGHA